MAKPKYSPSPTALIVIGVGAFGAPGRMTATALPEPEPAAPAKRAAGIASDRARNSTSFSASFGMVTRISSYPSAPTLRAPIASSTPYSVARWTSGSLTRYASSIRPSCLRAQSPP